MITASYQCPHTSVHINVNNGRLADTNLQMIEISMQCKICECAMIFQGPRTEPTSKLAGITPDGRMMILPLLPAGELLRGTVEALRELEDRNA